MFVNVCWLLAPLGSVLSFDLQQDMKTEAARNKMHTLDQIKSADLETSRKADEAEEAKRKRIELGLGHDAGDDAPAEIQPGTSDLLDDDAPKAKKKKLASKKTAVAHGPRDSNHDALVQIGYKGKGLELNNNFILWGHSQATQIAGVRPTFRALAFSKPINVSIACTSLKFAYPWVPKTTTNQ
jgi:hypothetical protein